MLGSLEDLTNEEINYIIRFTTTFKRSSTEGLEALVLEAVAKTRSQMFFDFAMYNSPPITLGTLHLAYGLMKEDSSITIPNMRKYARFLGEIDNIIGVHNSIEVYEDISRIVGFDSESIIGVARGKIKKGEKNEALDILREIKKNSENEEDFIRTGYMLANNGLLDRGVEYMDFSLAKFGRSILGLESLADILKNGKRFDHLEEVLVELVGLDDCVETRFDLAKLHYERGVDYFRSPLSIITKNGITYTKNELVRREFFKSKEQLATIFERVGGRDQQEFFLFDLYILSGRIELGLDDPNTAEKLFRDAREIQELGPDQLYSLAVSIARTYEGSITNRGVFTPDLVTTEVPELLCGAIAINPFYEDAHTALAIVDPGAHNTIHTSTLNVLPKDDVLRYGILVAKAVGSIPPQQYN